MSIPKDCVVQPFAGHHLRHRLEQQGPAPGVPGRVGQTTLGKGTPRFLSPDPCQQAGWSKL